MKTTVGIFFVICLAGGFTAGCGKKKDDKTTQTSLKLTGAWNAPCKKEDWFNFTQVKERYHFTPLGGFHKTTEVMKDDCATSELAMKIGGTYDSLGGAQDVPGATNINFTISSASLTPNTNEMVDILNKTKFCSISDWAAGKEQDILGKKCSGMDYTKGQVVYDIYKEDGNRLTFGRRDLFLVGGSSDHRPSKLDQDTLYVRE